MNYRRLCSLHICDSVVENAIEENDVMFQIRAYGRADIPVDRSVVPDGFKFAEECVDYIKSHWTKGWYASHPCDLSYTFDGANIHIVNNL